MKKTIIALAIFASAPVFADSVFSCDVVKVHNSNIFEEGLSVEEYSDVSLDEVSSGLELSVGAMINYETTGGDTINIKSSRSSFKVIAQYADSSEIVTIEINRKTGRGQLMHKANLRSRAEKIATLKCK